jgi:hypothetical protein
MPSFLLKKHPMEPRQPLMQFKSHSAIMGFDICRNGHFRYGDIFIAEFGSRAPETTGGRPLPGLGHKVTGIDMRRRETYTFAVNYSGHARPAPAAADWSGLSTRCSAPTMPCMSPTSVSGRKETIVPSREPA